MKWRSLEESGSSDDTRPLKQIFAERKALIAKYVPADVQAIHDRTIAMLKAQGLAARALNKTQLLGRRIFQQRCGVCHTQPTASPMYGIVLSKEIVDGNEDTVREYIRNGSKKMPGFKYGLEPAEIDAIVEYLKAVPKPAPKSSQAGVAGPVD